MVGILVEARFVVVAECRAAGMLVTEPNLRQSGGNGHSRQWIRHVITLPLFVAVILSGLSAFHARNLWWEKYLSYIHQLGFVWHR